MKSIRKKIFVFATVFAIMACSLASPALASSNTNDSIVPYANEVCGGLSYHKMRAHGTGTVYVNGSRYFSGYAWQCENCNLVMVTEGTIIFNQMQTIGKWATIPCSYEIANVITIDQPSGYGVCYSNTMDGYRFFLAN